MQLQDILLNIYTSNWQNVLRFCKMCFKFCPLCCNVYVYHTREYLPRSSNYVVEWTVVLWFNFLLSQNNSSLTWCSITGNSWTVSRHWIMRVQPLNTDRKERMCISHLVALLFHLSACYWLQLKGSTPRADLTRLNDKSRECEPTQVARDFAPKRRCLCGEGSTEIYLCTLPWTLPGMLIEHVQIETSRGQGKE